MNFILNNALGLMFHNNAIGKELNHSGASKRKIFERNFWQPRVNAYAWICLSFAALYISYFNHSLDNAHITRTKHEENIVLFT